MTAPTVQIPRAVAEVLVEFLSDAGTMPGERLQAWLTPVGSVAEARAILESSLTAAAEAAAWEPFRPAVGAFAKAGDDDCSIRSSHEQRAMAVVERFRHLGLDARDPLVIRPALAGLSAVEADVRPHASCARPVLAHLTVVASGLAELAPSEVKR